MRSGMQVEKLPLSTGKKKKVMFQKPEKFLMMAGLVLLDKLTLKSVTMLGEMFFKNFKSTEELTIMIIRKYKTKIKGEMRA